MIWSPEKSAAASFNTTFTVPANRTVKKAVCVVGAASRFELTLNGTLVGQGRNVAESSASNSTPASRS